MSNLWARLMIAFGAVMLVGAISSLMDPKLGESGVPTPRSLIGDLALTMFLGVFPLVWGWNKLRSNRREAQRRLETQQQLNLMREAERLGGRITLSEAMSILSMDIESSKKVMDKMLQLGAFELLISDSGTLVYKVHGSVAGDKSGVTGVSA